MKFSGLILLVSTLCISVLGQSKARYKIRSEFCKDDKCSVHVYVAPKHYNKTNLQNLAQELAAKYTTKEIVNLRVFNNKKIIDAYIKGVRKPINIGSDSQAYFIHKSGCGDMLFYKSKNNKVELIKINWEDTKACNEPFSVF